MDKKKWLWILPVILGTATVFTGCAPKIVARDSNPKAVTTTEQSNEKKKSVRQKIITPSEEPVVLKIVDWSDSTKTRREQYNKKFMEENKNVTIEYTTLTADQFKETVVSAIKAGDAPDLFPIPNGVKLNAVSDWYVPLDEYMEVGFFDGFTEGALNEGITNLDGEVYLLPESSNIINTLMFYNKKVLREAGVGEEELPKTWSEFRDVCKEISDKGKGKFYGMIDSGAQTNRLELEIRSLASLAGGKCGDISQIILEDGRNKLNSREMVQAFAFYESLVESGAMHPDSTLLKAPEARALFAQNQAAFIVQGSWCISTWRTENPNLEFGVMALPVPDEGQLGKLPYVGAQAWMGISADSEHPDVAAKYLQGLYSAEYQSLLVKDGGFLSVIEGINEKNLTDHVMAEYYRLHKEQAALVPDPIVSDAKTAQVYSAVTSITPGLGDIMQGVLASLVDYEKELDILSQKTQEEWIGAIDKTKEKGVSVSGEDFEFPNWDPMKNYNKKMYEER